jgi:uncharacterized beta-barrel protein YwiB (DUF1934 family)
MNVISCRAEERESVMSSSVSIPVSVELETRHQGGMPDIRRYAGLLYPKPRGQYLVYEEEAGSDAGAEQTRTTVRLDGEELKLVRRGAVESEQTFAAGRVTLGSYRLPHGTFELETHTHALRVDSGAPGMETEWPRPLNVTAAWRYDLKLGGEPAGEFEIRLSIWEEV